MKDTVNTFDSGLLQVVCGVEAKRTVTSVPTLQSYLLQFYEKKKKKVGKVLHTEVTHISANYINLRELRVVRNGVRQLAEIM